ncbi:MAG: phosphoglucosamine mutase [Fimbriimonadales bacterium]|nr:phosphoglucosamine mutase [Fimbriimonadales bacterium]
MSLFGTDGVRGRANTELTADFAIKLGAAAGTWVRASGGTRVVIGRDTRRSGSMLGAALSAGFCSAGVDVVTLGVAPTPLVSFAARSGGFALGSVVSASHNPSEDNGIKFLGSDGGKLSTEQEREIESILETNSSRADSTIGMISSSQTWHAKYRSWLAGFLPGGLAGTKVAIDCANGAAYDIAPQLLADLGAEVVPIGTEPDGDNINRECGATFPQVVAVCTLRNSASLGIAFDGDADRCVFSDEKGNLVNGDRFMAYWAIDAQARGQLVPSVVVGTVMSNLGFESALRSHGIAFERTPVGDRNVAERMRELGAKIGGEQSGHIIFGEMAPTGDGLLTMVQMLAILKRSNKPCSELPPLFDNWPQAMVNIMVDRKDGWDENPEINRAIRAAEEATRGSGRVVVRASGTQPMIRVMVEAREAVLRDQVLESVVESIETQLSGTAGRRIELTNALGD